MGTLSPFTIDVYTVTLERELVERRRAAAEQRLLALPRDRDQRPPGAPARPRPHGRGRLTVAR
ncbi:MAG: hypothetical protein EA416_08420 [Trueperaceae bacterium]|nr:MAG: hypothetical protein EA416_08420 [Trueperaceae bacterium]